MSECKDCAKYEGNCGNHFKDNNGHILWDCPNESMYDGMIGDTPRCFEPSKKYMDNLNSAKAKELTKLYSKDVLELALTYKKRQEPKKPLDQVYAPPDFCTYGKCPTCGEKVEGNSISGHSDEECPNCGQKLDWGKR